MTELMKMVAANLITYVLVVVSVILGVLAVVFLVPWQDIIFQLVGMVWEAIANQ